MSLPQDERLSRGYHQSVLEDENEEDNEAYNYRIKLMKNVVRSAITLSLEVVPAIHLTSGSICPWCNFHHLKPMDERSGGSAMHALTVSANLACR